MALASSSSLSRPTRQGGVAVIGVVLVLALQALVGLLTAGPAAAHAQLIGSSPSDGATVTAVPPEVVLRFNEKISTQFVTITVTSAEGADATLGRPTVEGSRVLQPLNPRIDESTYRVNFKVISADGHPISGSLGFTYTVAGGSRTSTAPTTATSRTTSTTTSSTSSTTTATTSSSPTTSETSTSTSPATSSASSTSSTGEPAAAGNDGPPSWLLVALGLLVLALIAGVIATMRGRRADSEFDESFEAPADGGARGPDDSDPGSRPGGHHRY